MIYLAWTLIGLMAGCGFIGWCCVRAGALSDLDEAELDAACEGAIIRDLSDIEFSSPARRI